LRLVVFRLEKDRYALPLDAVREVIDAPAQFSRVPRSKPWVLGVMAHRGRVVPVVDLSSFLVEDSAPLPTPAQPAGGSKVVLLELSRRELGLLVTDVDGISTIEKVGAQQKGSRVVRGLARVGPLTVTVLDVEGLDAAVAASIVNG
jgi:purine-binding chemotaxis protein CheW